MKRVSVALSVLAALATAVPAAMPADVVTAKDLPQITVTGSGKVSTRPDMAEINVGVSSQAATAAAALTANNKAMAALMAELKTGGIEERDVLTSNFNVSPVYDDRPMQPSSQPRAPRIVGYRVDNTVQVRVRKLASLGVLLDTLVRSGANNMNGISFTVAQPEPLLDKARTMAIADARRKAELYAQAAGVKVGRVLFINESGGYAPPMPMFRAAAPMAADASVPIATGEQEMQSSVQVVYAIE